jgi:hypothetical protein
MPKSTVGDAPDLYPLPEGQTFDGQLVKCEEVEVPFTYRKGDKAGQKGSFKKWEWTLVVTTGEFMNIEVRGSTEPRITDATDSEFQPLAKPDVEAFLARSIGIGEEIDTDELIGLWCKFSVRHQEPRARKGGDGFWYNVEVDEVFPYHATNGAAAAQPALEGTVVGAAGVPAYDEPPF